MTAIANPPILPSINRPFWAPNGSSHQPVGAAQQSDEFSRFLPPRGGKPLERSNSLSSVSSASSSSSLSTVLSTPQSTGSSVSSNGDINVNTWTASTPRKRPQAKGPWPGPQKHDQPTPNNRLPTNNGAVKPTSTNVMLPAPVPPQQGMGTRSGGSMVETGQGGQVALYLLSLNGTFDRKTISVPFYPDTLRIGRQTNQKTIPTPTNGFFDSKVLSRQHAEIWADRSTGKVYIRDVKSSNGTFVNGNRLSQENRESEPYQLNAGDHLELGIDIVHEDQKTVVHHKVAAKVEHVGFLSSSMSEIFSENLDPSAGGNTLQSQGVAGRGRAGNSALMASNGRMAPTSGGMIGSQTNGMGPSRPVWMAQITTDQIVKRLHQEMRNSRLQAQDLLRTGQFVGALLTKQDVKELEKPEAHEPSKSHVNGNLLGPFQAVNGKTRFSDPPAPPPQQPLPEKPDVARNGDVPSLKRGTTERPKGQKETPSQVAQIAEDLKMTKKELESQSARMRDLEEMLSKERGARKVAEELAKKLEAAAAKATETKPGGKELDEAFNPPAETTRGMSPEVQHDAVAALQKRLEGLMAEMLGLKQQLKEYKERAINAEEERDATRKSLSDMVLQIREEQASRKAAEDEAQSLKKRWLSKLPVNGSAVAPVNVQEDALVSEPGENKEAATVLPSLSQSSTIMPSKVSGQLAHRHAMTQTLPYASMISVVVLGMGLMAYLNGWQPEPRLQR